MFPATSVNVHVLIINPAVLQSINPERSSVFKAFNKMDGVQLSVSSFTPPVTDGSSIYVQSEALQIVIVGGTVKVGAVTSCTVMTWTHSL